MKGASGAIRARAPGALVANALRWAGGSPLAAVDTWPDGARLAVLFGLDTEFHFENAAAAVELLTRAQAHGTFFCVSDLARAHADTVAAITRVGEIGSHTDDHQLLAGQTPAAQQHHLEASAAALSALGASRVEGLRPPEEAIAAATLEATARAGYTYLAGTGKDRSEPSLEGGLVLMPRIPNDDFHWLMKEHVTDAAALTDAMRADLAQSERLGGLYFFSFHTQMLDQPALQGALAALLRATAGREMWRAEGREIAAWWRARAGVQLGVEPRDKGRLRVRVTSTSALPSLGVTVYVARVGTKPTGTAVQGAAPTRVTAASDPDAAVHLRLEGVRAGESRVFDVDPS